MLSCCSRLWYFLSPLDGASVREAHCAQTSTAVRCTEAPCAQASTAVRFSARSALRAGYWPTCLTDGHMVVNDHTRLAENWKCVWYFLRPILMAAVRARMLYSYWSTCHSYLYVTTKLFCMLLCTRTTYSSHRSTHRITHLQGSHTYISIII